MIDLAHALKGDVRFQNAVTMADVDQVPIGVVLHERDVLTKAARLARLDIHNARELAAQQRQPTAP